MNNLHISWDLWGTLIGSNPVYKQKRNWLFRHIFGEKLTDDSLKEGKAFVDYINETTSTHLSYSQIISIITKGGKRENFAENVEQFRVKNAQLVALHPPKLKEGVKETLEELFHEGVTMNIMSNTSTITGESLRQVVGLLDINRYFLFQIYSDEFGASKPNPLLYSFLRKHVRKERAIVHIGDNAFTDIKTPGNEVIVTKDVTLLLIPEIFKLI